MLEKLKLALQRYRTKYFTNFEHNLSAYKSKEDFYAKCLRDDGWTNLPCVMGDKAWGIRYVRGKPIIRYGPVSQMYYSSDMSLIIVIKGVARGTWGTTVFPTLAAAEKYIENKFNNEGENNNE